MPAFETQESSVLDAASPLLLESQRTGTHKHEDLGIHSLQKAKHTGGHLSTQH